MEESVSFFFLRGLTESLDFGGRWSWGRRLLGWLVGAVAR